MRATQNSQTILQRLLENGLLRDLDVQLMDSLQRVYAVELSTPLAVLLALTSRVSAAGHVCLDLSRPDWQQLAWREEETAEWLSGALETPEAAAALLPEAPALIGDGDGKTPFVYEQRRLYLRRFREYEMDVAARLRRLSDETPEAVDALTLDPALNVEQQAAVRLACTKRLAIITGGPGTGKTFVAAHVLRGLAGALGTEGKPLRVRLAAPTGKAAQRLNEALGAAREKGVWEGCFLDCAPAVTLHRLLGAQAGTVELKHDADSPLAADVLVVDECSMVELPQMSHLLEAIGTKTRLILLGDAHQLSSVGPGAVMADLCAASTLQANVAVLTESQRFAPDSPIALVSGAINAGDAAAAWAEAEKTMWRGSSVVLRDAKPVPVLDEIREGFAAFRAAKTPEAAFAALQHFRILCAVRRGPFGVEKLNALVRRHLFGSPEDAFFSHRVILITRNDAETGLSNGDVGVVLPDAAGELKVYFDGRETSFSRLQLPEHEDGFAMTIHKAQGTGFKTVCVVLPDEKSPVLSRELLYTAITRAEESVSLWCTPDIFQAAVETKTLRIGGLRDRLDRA